MDFPKDDGLSCVRYYLVPRDQSLESLARDALTSPGKHVGSLVCQCGEVNQWRASFRDQDTRAHLVCTCNGSSLPIYIFHSGESHQKAKAQLSPHHCERQGLQIAVAIGYPGEVPLLGSMDVESAQEIVLAARCCDCQEILILWHLQLSSAPVFTGNEPFLRRIQGYRERTFWSKLSPSKKASHPDASPKELVGLVYHHPMEVLQNPALPLIALEDPTQWMEIQKSAKRQLLQERLGALSVAQQERWRRECARRVLQQYTPTLTAAEREREQNKDWSRSAEAQSIQYQDALDAEMNAFAGFHLPAEERHALYQKAVTAWALFICETSRFDEMPGYLEKVSALPARAEGRDAQDSARAEYEWMESTLQQIEKEQAEQKI
jgi:hypothetical protein